MVSEVKKRRPGHTRLSSQRQVSLPAAVVKQLGLATGDELRVDLIDGRVVLSAAGVPDSPRVRAIATAAGSLSRVYGRGYLRKVRDEWR